MWYNRPRTCFGERRRGRCLLIELAIDSVQVSLISNHRVVLLKERKADRYLPIWIGPCEADAIVVELRGQSPPRPQTHDLLRNVIQELGGRVSYVLINDLSSNTFYARVIMEVNGEITDIDTRPSDAIALAVRTKSPVFVSEEVMERAAITESPDVRSDSAEGGEQKDSDDLGAFREFVDSLDLD
jgi:bifunctional DNase/RNase